MAEIKVEKVGDNEVKVHLEDGTVINIRHKGPFIKKDSINKLVPDTKLRRAVLVAVRKFLTAKRT